MPQYAVETGGELHPFLAYEWLLTNGIGSFASGTVVGCNTRRYHGLLCAATTPPVGRVMALNRIGELVFIDGRPDFLELSISQFGHGLHPRGDRYLRRFELGRTACWHYEVEGVRISKELLLAHGRNLAGVRYRVQSETPRQVELHLLPFVSLRDFHGLRRQGGELVVKADHFELTVAEGDRRLRLRTDAGKIEQRHDWWFGHNYPIETERGLDDIEDLFQPGIVMQRMQGNSTLTVWAAMDGADGELPDWDAEVAKIPMPPAKLPAPGRPAGEGHDVSGPVAKLLRAANDFVVARRQPDGSPGTTIIAGYPWFADWGRDTMISLPGLLLVPGRYAEAAQVLSLFAQYVSEGMIPNRFDDYTNEPSYNTVDASLWFIHACFEYLRFTGDTAVFEGKLLGACRAIVEGYQKGTRFGIHMDERDGLIVAGDASTQLTWMDAKAGKEVFTPRHGKAVEINALWYHALMLLGRGDLAEKTREGFVKAFWRNPFRGLYDVVREDGRDEALRPNQIFAASLPHSPLDEDKQRAVVEVVRRELLTPYGLRTLARDDAGYERHFRGGPAQRDRAYHNGTVWPWLIGPFLDAFLRVNQDSPDARRQARVWLQPLIDHMNQGCIGQISECFEADEPHRPVACPAQAWSVAEVLRLAARLEI